jgi:hypothetical protein
VGRLCCISAVAFALTDVPELALLAVRTRHCFQPGQCGSAML